MKRLIKRLVGEYVILRLKDLIRKCPTKSQKVAIMRELEQSDKMQLFYSSFINDGDLCFDVGANIGNRIKPLLQVGARVVAVEPQAHCRKFLKYKFGDDIAIVAQGLGERESVKDFYISNASTLSSFSTDWIASVKSQRFKGYNWDKVVKIKMTTLDKLIEKYGTPTFIKIDVEGYELAVLTGLSKPVNTISIEYTVPEQLDKLIECLKRIRQIDAAVDCNFSVGESMTLSLTTWISIEDMLKHILTKEFIATEFGDVYVRRNCGRVS
ncbi:MAG: FkbM family methyltransferase [Cytophagaceae bacterium]|nr:MAG: FkbM family methyltransferase [Cytophagaceae bacterium]